MTESLQKLPEQAEQEHHAEEERKAKRPRGNLGDGQAAPGGNAMQPFGVPGLR